MPRQISEERLREYGDLKRFFEVWQTQLFPNQFFRAEINSLGQIIPTTQSMPWLLLSSGLAAPAHSLV